MKRRSAILTAIGMVVFVDVFFNLMLQFIVLRKQTRNPPIEGQRVFAMVVIDASLAEQPTTTPGWMPAYVLSLELNGMDLVGPMRDHKMSPRADDPLELGENISVTRTLQAVSDVVPIFVPRRSQPVETPTAGRDTWTIFAELGESKRIKYRLTDPTGSGNQGGVLPVRVIVSVSRSDGVDVTPQNPFYPAFRLEQHAHSGSFEIDISIPWQGEVVISPSAEPHR